MKFLLLLNLIFIPSMSFAQVLDVLYQGTSSSKNEAQVRQQIMDKAIEESSYNYITEIIGEVKTQKNKTFIKKNIIRNSGKYVSYIKADKLTQDPTSSEYKMNVAMKVSLDELKNLLLANGLLYKSEGAPIVLPLVSFQDRKNSEELSWWAGSSENSFLLEQLSDFHSALRRAFDEKQFYLIKPVENHLQNLIPDEFKNPNPNADDIIFLSDFFNAAIVVRGSVQIKAKDNFSDHLSIVLNLTALQSGNGRVIADVKRQYVTEAGAFKTVVQKKMAEVSDSLAQDLVNQVYSAWQKGTLGSSLLKITLLGKLDYKDLSLIKKNISYLKEIRGMRERLFAPGRTTFEVDASILPQNLADLLATVKTEKYELVIDDVEASEIELKVKARR